MGTANAPTPVEFALLEKRESGYLADALPALALKNGLLEISKLAPGDYDLFLKSEKRIVRIKIAGGEALENYAASQTRPCWKSSIRSRYQIRLYTEISADTIKVTLVNAGKLARLHAVATRYQPAFPMWSQLGKIEFEEPASVTISKADSQYLIGRDIGDEYRYILERKSAKKFPGNMLDRPSLLLNPWAIRKTDTELELPEGGSSFGNVNGGGRKLMVKRAGSSVAPVSSGGILADLDFMPAQSVVLHNLRPDANGVVTIARKDLGQGQQLHLFAADPENSVYRQVALPEIKLEPLDLRLPKSLDANKHLTERKRGTVVAAGGTFKLADIATSTVEPYDSLARVYGLYTTLLHDDNLNEFSFVTRWPSLTPAEKRTQYSKYASHELNFFIFKKDPEFFTAAVQPYLKNKKDKTFLDHFLIEDDLAEYLKPWAYGQLNIVERILLMQRIEAEIQAGARHVSDLYDLIPPNVEQETSLFLVTLQGSSLETTEGLGLERAKQTINGPARKLAEAKGLGFDKAPQENAYAAPPATAAAPAPMGRMQQMDALKKADLKDSESDRAGLSAADGVQDEARKSGAMAKEKAAAGIEFGVQAGKPGQSGGNQGLRSEMRHRGANQEEEQLVERQLARQFYRKLDATEELVENNYNHLPIEEQIYGRVPVNAFWRDYADYVSKGNKGGFFSEHLAEASRNFTEVFFALAVLDLPFEAQKHVTEFKGAEMTLTAKSPMILFHKEIREGENGGKSAILVSENFFKADDRYKFDKNERSEKYVEGEFLSRAVYGCQVILTNPTANPQKLELLMQIPQGAIPVSNGFVTKSIFSNLAPYSTSSTEYFFYFPLPGQFTHYPVQVAKDEKILAFAAPETLTVVDKLTKADTASWDYISQNGTNDEVIAFLKNNNINRLNLELIAWRMKDAAFFDLATTLLAQRHIYNDVLWAYAIKHGRPEVVREYLQHNSQFADHSGPIIDSPLLTIDPVIRKTYQHMEYSPLVNARAHRLGRTRKIVNERAFQQYERLLNVLAYRPALDNTDLMAVTYYMLLQDRVEEGLNYFGRVRCANALPTRLQYDFFKCYTNFYQGDPAAARALAAKYEQYPVDRWRNEFAMVRAQCDEIDGKDHTVVDKENKVQQQAALAATEPHFDFTVEARKLAINYQNIGEVRVNYYLMDIELLFSGNPFVQEYAGQFSYIHPNKSDTIALPAGQKTLVVDLPKEYHASNVMVEILGAGQHQSRAYYANTIDVQTVENYGSLRVLNQDTHKAESKVYVKVYAKNHNGGVEFYKDGYTDLRGKFDYASLSTNGLDNVEKFAVLIMSENNGALVSRRLRRRSSEQRSVFLFRTQRRQGAKEFRTVFLAAV